MIHGLFFVLKILGILLLVLLLFLAAALFAALFEPVRYRIKGEFPGNGKAAFGEGRVSWLFGAVSVRGRFLQGEGLRLRAKLLGITLWKSGGETEADSGRSSAGEDAAGDSAGHTMEQSAKRSAENTGKSMEEGSGQMAGTFRESADTDAFGKDAHGLEEADENSAGPGPKRRIGERIQAFFDKIYGRLRKLAFSIREFCGKLKNMAGKAEKIKDWFTDEKNQASFRLLLRQGKRLAAHGLPRKGRGEITFGFEDPCLTGQVLAAASLVYPFCHRRLNLYPVFDGKILEGNMDFRGRIRSAYILWLAWGIWKDRHTRRMIKRALNRRRF